MDIESMRRLAYEAEGGGAQLLPGDQRHRLVLAAPIFEGSALAQIENEEEQRVEL